MTPSTSVGGELPGRRSGRSPADHVPLVVDHRPLRRRCWRSCSLASALVGGSRAQLAQHDLGVAVGGLAAGRVALLDEVRAHEPVRRDGEERRQRQRAEREDEQDPPAQPDAAGATQGGAASDRRRGSVGRAIGAVRSTRLRAPARRRARGLVGDRRDRSRSASLTSPSLQPVPEPAHRDDVARGRPGRPRPSCAGDGCGRRRGGRRRSSRSPTPCRAAPRG